jgi:hypothetical protein
MRGPSMPSELFWNCDAKQFVRLITAVAENKPDGPEKAGQQTIVGSRVIEP